MRKQKIINVWYYAMALYGIEGGNRRKGKQYIFWKNRDIWDYFENDIYGKYIIQKNGGNIEYRHI